MNCCRRTLQEAQLQEDMALMAAAGEGVERHLYLRMGAGMEGHSKGVTGRDQGCWLEPCSVEQ